jgi:leucyl-tRNA synthetase
MAQINFKKIEKKWQDKWEKGKIFEPEIDRKKKKFFCNFPYPYINGYSHIGHLFSIMRVEAFARYKRAKGFNVLFPQGWHITGSPIINAAKRIKDKEPKQIKIMKDMGIKTNEIKKFEKPEYWVKFFAPEYKKDYKSIGMSLDWRREFFTTSLNPYYDKFIQWQFNKLKEKNYCVQGSFPVVWDPKEKVVVGDHARIEGEGVTTQDFIWVKFRMKDSDLILMVIAKVDGEKWVVGKDTLYKIENQYKKAEIIGKITPKELIGKWFKGPLVNREIYSLPAWFIDSSVGSGIVYSALEDPVDLLQLQKIQADLDMVKDYNLNLEIVKKLKPIDIINVSGMGNNLGQEIAKEFGVENFEDKRKLEEAKGELNKRVFRKGIMNNRCGKFKGKTVPETQEILKKELVKTNDAIMFYELTGKVISRSLTECVVKIVDDQWFLNYTNENWKKKTHECLKQLKLYPEKSRSQFEYVIDWLHEWACTRIEGLGTKLPWDKKWLIESLSDSTIYMAYYTIAHLIKNFNIREINNEFFDYVFLGIGKGKNKWEKFKKEFEYWYPVDFRNSGKDLIQNHLTFFMFNHTAIFPKKYWPKGIGVNGWVTVDGQKMSKSLGNMIPIRNIMKKFGADCSRLTILSGGESMEDPNWDSKFAENLNKKFEYVVKITKNYNSGENKIHKVDEWIKNKLALHISEATKLMEETLFRSAIQKIYFELIADIKWYFKRVNVPNKKILNETIESLIILMQPFTPHLAEELWEKIGKKGFVSLEKWPEYKVKEFEDTEALVKKLLEDINNIKKITGKKDSKVYVYVLPKEIELYKEIKGINVFAVNDKNKYDPEKKAGKTKPGKPAIYLE